jgi:hypothetical protein
MATEPITYTYQMAFATMEYTDYTFVLALVLDTTETDHDIILDYSITNNKIAFTQDTSDLFSDLFPREISSGTFNGDVIAGLDASPQILEDIIKKIITGLKQDDFTYFINKTSAYTNPTAMTTLATDLSSAFDLNQFIGVNDELPATIGALLAPEGSVESNTLSLPFTISFKNVNKISTVAIILNITSTTPVVANP